MFFRGMVISCFFPDIRVCSWCEHCATIYKIVQIYTVYAFNIACVYIHVMYIYIYIYMCIYDIELFIYIYIYIIVF